MTLYEKYRPRTFKAMVGQDTATSVLVSVLKKRKAGKVHPHVLLFTGPSGCGKTTLARIVRDKLECHEADFVEQNCADFRGIDMVREIRTRMHGAPMGGGSRIWLIDECHQMTKDAQTALLKMLEDTPKHVYFMLATTDPGKLLKTIITRSTEVQVRALNHGELMDLLHRVCVDEEFELTDQVRDRIVEVSDGSARKALVILDQVMGIDGEEEQLNVIISNDAKKLGIDIARALMDPSTKWPAMVKLIKATEGEEPETIRRIVLGYAASMMGVPKFYARAYMVALAFRDHYFECGKAGLMISCYEVCHNS